MTKSHASEVKRERKKSLFLREITKLIQDLASQEPVVADVYVSNIDMSANTGICYVFFSSYLEPGEEIFLRAMQVLKLYKPSLRKAFAARVQTRYAPDLFFMFDRAKEKERKVNDLLNKVQDELEQTKE